MYNTSYKINLYFTDLTFDQQNVINFLDGKENLVGDYVAIIKPGLGDIYINKSK